MWVIVDLFKYLVGGLMQVVAFILFIGFPGYFILLAFTDNPLGNIEYLMCIAISMGFWNVVYQSKFGHDIIDKYLKIAFRFIGG